MAPRKPATKTAAKAETTEPKAKKAPAKAKKAAEPATPLIPEAVAEAPKPKKAPAKAKKAADTALAVESAEAAPAPAAAPAKPAPKAKAQATAQAGLPAQAEAILAAMREGRALEFIFTDADTNPPRTFEPRQLTFDALAQAWFVWGWDRRYNAERHHRVDLLAEVNDVEGVGRSAQGPYKEGTPANQIGGWLGGDPIAVKAVLMKQWIFAVKQAPAPFPDFKIADGEEGKATVTFSATDLRAIARWCMQFGDGIQVLEPQRLVERLKQAGTAWGGKPAAAPAPAPAAKPRAEEPKRHAEPRAEQHREHKREPHREEPKAAKGPKVELRIERL